MAVMDLGWMVERDCDYLSNKCDYLIPDGLFAEVVTSDRAEARAKKLWRISGHNADRLFVGKIWKRIADAEWNTGQPVTWKAVIDDEWSEQWRHCVRRNALEDFLKATTHGAYLPTAQSYELKRERFLQFCEDIRIRAGDKAKAWERRHNVAGEAMRIMQDPELFFELIVTYFPEYRTPEWQTRLQVFPDTFAIGRWFRLLTWTIYKWTIGHTKKRENDWDDAQYAFLASHTGELITIDKGLAELVSMVFPDVRVRE